MHLAAFCYVEMCVNAQKRGLVGAVENPSIGVGAAELVA